MFSSAMVSLQSAHETTCGDHTPRAARDLPISRICLGQRSDEPGWQVRLLVLRSYIYTGLMPAKPLGLAIQKMVATVDEVIQ